MTKSLVTLAPSATLSSACAMILARGKSAVSALQIARETMGNPESMRTLKSAIDKLQADYSSLSKEKRQESVIRAAISAVVKDQSTAISYERKALKKDYNDSAAEIAQLYALYPLRFTVIKGVYVLMTHAEFDARNAGKRKDKDTDTGEGASDGDGVSEGGAAKGTDKAAAAIAALQAQVATLTAERDAALAALRTMTADRDDARSTIDALDNEAIAKAIEDGRASDAAKVIAAKPVTRKRAKLSIAA